MACEFVVDEKILKLYEDLKSPFDESDKTKIKLPQGGYVVKSNIGNIQFGIVPQTVKDSINIGIEVPTYYVVPTERFDKQFCLSVCEFQFPAYFNFFVKKRQIVLICTKEAEICIRNIFQETLLGPKNFDDLLDDFDPNFDKEAIPDLEKEFKQFAKNPFNPSQPLTIDLLIEFKNFDEAGVVQIMDIKIVKDNQTFLLYQLGELKAKIPDQVRVRIPNSIDYTDIYLPPLSSEDIEEVLPEYKEKPIESKFQAPNFGITILGCSHGFDPKGSNSGYILWVNGRGIMVDPPPYSTLELQQMGIPSFLIGWVIITHCHADHDAGAFQKILESQKVELVTTKTIMNSFVRKYSALCSLSTDEIKKLFTFRPAIIGTPCQINGTLFQFYYSLHTIPCIGFTVSNGVKSLYFSGDTFYDPENMEKKFIASGIMTQQRLEHLIDFQHKFNHDLILHEMGVPPIHTPKAVLAALPQEIKDKIVLVHVSQKDIDPESGLKAAQTGIENTIIIDNAEISNSSIMLQRLSLIADVPIFEKASLKNVRELIDSIEIRTYQSGDRIVKEGDVEDEFFIVENGTVKIFSEHKNFERYLYIGDYFGEASLYKGCERQASAQALTDVSTLVIKRNDFWFIFSDTRSDNVLEDLKKLMESRKKFPLQLYQLNALLNSLNTSQKIQFEQMIIYQKFNKDDFIWKEGEDPSCILLYQGKLRLVDEPQKSQLDIKVGNLVGEIESIVKGKKTTTSLVCLEESIVFQINQKQFLHFLEKNPGIFLLTEKSFIVY